LALIAGVETAWAKEPRILGAFRPRDKPMSDEQPMGAEHYREIAERIRQLAQQTRIAEVQQELSDLADRVERMVEDDATAGLGNP
jgi:hypothetical protein